MTDENALTQALHEAGPRYIVDAQQRPVGYLLTPEELPTIWICSKIALAVRIQR